jgi:hypothetical protein
MQRAGRVDGGIPIPWAVAMFLAALAAFIASGFAIRTLPLWFSDTDALIAADFIVPCVALWIVYWAIFHFSAYLRPRTVWREFGFLVLSLGLVPFSWWIRVVALSSRYGM